MTDTVLRACGTAVLVSLMGLAALSRTDRPGIPIDFGGSIERFGDDSIFVATSTNGIREVHLTSSTVVRDGEAVAERTALRPGHMVTVHGTERDFDGRLTARQLAVWGPAR